MTTFLGRSCKCLVDAPSGIAALFSSVNNTLGFGVRSSSSLAFSRTSPPSLSSSVAPRLSCSFARASSAGPPLFFASQAGPPVRGVLEALGTRTHLYVSPNKV